MEVQTFFDFNTSTCFMDKELVGQYKLAPMEKSTPVPIKVIDGQNLS
jgi:hypothetical protein